MKRFAAFCAAASLGACAESPEAETRQRPQVAAAQEGNDVSRPTGSTADAGIPADCALLVAFGSYAMGIDRETLRRVELLFESDPAVIAVTRTPWGREGEVTLCAAIRGATDRDRLFAAVAALFPARPHGPLSVRTGDGREFQANNATGPAPTNR